MNWEKESDKAAADVAAGGRGFMPGESGSESESERRLEKMANEVVGGMIYAATVLLLVAVVWFAFWMTRGPGE